MDLKQSFFQIKILHVAMFVGVLLFAVISYVFHNFLNIGDSLTLLPDNAFYLVVLLAGILLWVSGLIYKKRISKIDSDLSLKERIETFRSAAVLRVAVIEAAALVVIMAHLLSGDILFLLIAFIPLSFFAFTFPKDEVMIEAMELSYSEVQQLS